MTFQIDNISGREPLLDYPWRSEIDRLLTWLQDKEAYIRAFCFDLVMSAAYIDAASGIEATIEQCDSIPQAYNAHLGFINLCAPCYLNQSQWVYQKAIKPQSGALGKLSSELILRFIEKLHPRLTEVVVVGGVGSIDAILKHQDGLVILAEVKSAPLLTYPFLFQLPDACLRGHHKKPLLTNSQLRTSSSAMFLHNNGLIPLGQVGDTLWPFRPLVDFITAPDNFSLIMTSITDWLAAREAYASKDKQNRMYYLTNASGSPPQIAKVRDSWPRKATISDSKTSAGMDRTDDIKKGIYQSLKMGVDIGSQSNIKTAIVSNLPAYRHGEIYVDPFVNMLWGVEEDLELLNGRKVLAEENLRYVFDYIITLDGSILRYIEL